MYNQDYEEYMRSVLGYQTNREASPSYVMDNNYSMMNMMEDNHMDTYEMYEDAEKIEKMYPEIYTIVYPMVQKACVRNCYTNY